MNAVGNNPIRNWRRWMVPLVLTFAAVLIFLALCFGLLAALRPEPLFHGKPESVWIKQLKYHDDEQVKEWRGYGEEGVQVLIRGLERATHPGARAYRRFSARLPAFVKRLLPAAKPDSTQATRQCLVALLGSLGSHAKSAARVMIRTAGNDEASSVRQGAIGYFITSAGDDTLLNQLPAGQKEALLPALLNGMQDAQLRHNAAFLLKFYPEHREAVAPVLLRALRDPNPYVRLSAAQALNRVAPDLAKTAGATSMLAAFAKDPNNQLAAQAVAALAASGSEPELAIPALIECLQSTNSLISAEAVWALERAPREFKPYAKMVIPALRNAANRKNHHAVEAKGALSKWESLPK
jgi:hypothetical protein